MYLTPERFKTMKTGVKLTGVSGIELAMVLADASNVVDAYCNVPLAAIGGRAFRGGSVTGEQHRWRLPRDPFDIGARRVWPYFRPVNEVTALRLVLTGSAGTTINPEGLVVDRQRGFVEIASAGLATGGLYGVLGLAMPNIGLENPIAEIDYSYGETYYLEERAYPVNDGNLIFQTPTAGQWAALPAPVVRVGGVIQNSGYTVDYDEGRVTFATAKTDPVTVTYTTIVPGDIQRATAKVAAFLLAGASLAQKGAVGVRRITAGEITIERQAGPQNVAALLDTWVPDAALLLNGYRYWRAA